METIKKHLRTIYLDPLKEETELYIGVELEFPIVNRNGGATDLVVSKALMRHLVEQGDWQIQQEDQDGNPVQLVHVHSGDCLLFEVAYTILEFAFAKARTIGQIEARFLVYLELIQTFLSQHNHELQACGIHPGWDKNDNQPVSLPRYRMLEGYLALSKTLPDGTCHDFPAYGSYICGNQVQLDVTRSNYLRVLNAFNQIEAAKAYLFANSSFSGADWDTTIARDIFWEESMHGLIPENVGLYPLTFTDEASYLAFQAQTAMFTVTRQGETYYFPPCTVTDYLTQDRIEVYDLNQTTHFIQPQAADLATHRSYHYQTLTRRGTVEFRSVCTQPFDLTFAPTAFHLGLLENLAELEAYLAQAAFFDQYGRDYPALRRRFAKKRLTDTEREHVREFSKKLLDLARKGLIIRGFSEENYLNNPWY